jgi:2-oxoglutarate dehydrogenase E1 component
MSTTETMPAASAQQSFDRDEIFDRFRRWGYLEAVLDPLGHLRPEPHPELELSGKAADEARAIYCGAIGAEFMHLPQSDRRQWVERRMEGPPSKYAAPEQILERLIRSEVFEQVIQARYLGTKRFSLEGLCGLIPLLDEILEVAAGRGSVQALMGMSHRGRLNVMLNIVGRDAAEIFAGFEDVDPRSVLGAGDVKYHMGATGQFTTRSGKKLDIHLVSNPSHLESVDPVVLGRTRAKQTRDHDTSRTKYLPIELHGDAAFAGQGIVAETLNLAGLEAYDVGGTIHVIGNNLIGFTTSPKDLHGTRFASDVAKRLPIPVFHVNAEDPEAVLRVAHMAAEYRYEFSSDVVIDLIGFRRHGHSEVDDPTITQPKLYQAINRHPPLWQIYAEKKKLEAAPIVEKVKAELNDAQKRGQTIKKKQVFYTLPKYWDKFTGGDYKPEYEVRSGLDAAELGTITESLTTVPSGFTPHPKIKKLLEERARMGSGAKPVDYGMAEALAFGSLLKQGVPIRMSGQDSRRGTFNQRHAVLIDVENEQEYIPLCHVSPNQDQAACEIYNSTLSEAAVLGYEYGYSRDYPETLVLWEAQFGDFANGAQIIIDQFASAGEDKWKLYSGLVLLLPHGYEGQGPEHSSARMERFLQLAAEDNMQICQPSNAAQYFHLLRRQALQKWRKPLVVFTPKSMLRHPDASSNLDDFSRERFLRVVPDHDIAEATRLLICTGKIGHELRQARAARKDTHTAIVFLDQLYPFPEKELEDELARHSSVREIIWVQEEPANMGALSYVLPRLERVAHKIPVRTIKRSASASPATGSAKAHEMEQKTLITLAFGK